MIIDIMDIKDIMEVFEAIIKGEKVNRAHEETLFYFLADCVGEGNVLTEILYKDDKVVYFGCAIRFDNKWKVYNLIGTGGVVVSVGRKPRLVVKAG